MSDEQKTGNADLSEVAAEMPAPASEVTVTRTPLAVTEDGDVKGESATPLTHEDGTVASMPTKVTIGVSGAEQLRKAQCKQRPCVACGHAQFIKPGSPRFIGLVEELARLRRMQVLDERDDLGPAGFVWCDDSADVSKDTGVPLEPGYRFIQHNCLNWTKRRTDLLPEWMPPFMRTNIQRIFTASDILREKGVVGYLSWLRRSFRVVRADS